MAWEIPAIWAVVIVTVIWFVRDELRQRVRAVPVRTVSSVAHAPRYRDISVEPLGTRAPPLQR